MSARVLTSASGRVLLVGTQERCAVLVASLEAAGYECVATHAADQVQEACRQHKPEAVVFASAEGLAGDALARLRQDELMRDVPLLADLRGDDAARLRKLDFDDWIHVDDELVIRVQASLRARRLVKRDAQMRLRMEKLLEITQAATSTLELSRIIQIAVEKTSEVIPTDRCSVVLVEGMPRKATVVASKEAPEITALPIDLVKYPELRRALETRQPIVVEDAERDPMMAEVRPLIAPLGVRSIMVQPLVCQDDLLGALFLRMSRQSGAFGRDEQEFIRAVGAALANSVRNAEMHNALQHKRDELESAYVDRYRELTEANKRLREADRGKDELIAIVSHDLRAPLQVLLGHGRLLAETNLTDEQKLSADAVVRQGKKILALVESLLERGRGEQARVSLEPVRMDLAELCKDVVRELDIIAKEKSIALRSDAPESLMVLGDQLKLEEVLHNLTINAIGHARSEVVIRAQKLERPDGDAARITVQDDGPGLPPNQFQLVFDKYRHGPGGIGLGLAICKEFVELHGGEIWAEAGAGAGCQFVFTLPLVQQVGRKERAPIAPIAPATEQPRVLVVEDEPQIAAVMEEILKSRYRVEVARDGAEGLAKATGLKPDLVVMDVFLPKLDGLDAAMALKASPETKDIPVILISAHQGVAEKVRALNLGAVDYMHKPFQALELLSRTDRALKLRETERELERSRKLLRRSGNDPETGLYDRSGIVQRLEQELSRSRRYSRPLTLALVWPDVALTDKTRVAASFVRGALRAPDVVGHLGAGTFAAILPESNLTDARGALGRLLPELQREASAKYSMIVEDVVATPEGDAELALERLVARAGKGQGAAT